MTPKISGEILEGNTLHAAVGNYFSLTYIGT